MLTLYHNDMSVCAAKVRTALAEKWLDCNLIHLDLRAGDTQKPEYLKLNPNAVVPTLVHDDRVIIESTVICEYIDDEWPGPPLKPSDSVGARACACGPSNLMKACMLLSDHSRSRSRSAINGSPARPRIAVNGWLAFRNRIVVNVSPRYSISDLSRPTSPLQRNDMQNSSMTSR